MMLVCFSLQLWLMKQHVQPVTSTSPGTSVRGRWIGCGEGKSVSVASQVPSRTVWLCHWHAGCIGLGLEWLSYLLFALPIKIVIAANQALKTWRFRVKNLCTLIITSLKVWITCANSITSCMYEYDHYSSNITTLAILYTFAMFAIVKRVTCAITVFIFWPSFKFKKMVTLRKISRNWMLLADDSFTAALLSYL